MDTIKKSFLNVFETVALNLDDKIDFLHQNEISRLTEVENKIAKLKQDIQINEEYNMGLPKAVAIDLSVDTSMLKKELQEQQRLKHLRESYYQFILEKQALKKAFIEMNVLILNKQVFYDLTKYFGLIRLYESKKKDDIYCVSGKLEEIIKSHSISVSQSETIYQHRMKQYKIDLNLYEQNVQKYKVDVQKAEIQIRVRKRNSIIMIFFYTIVVAFFSSLILSSDVVFSLWEQIRISNVEASLFSIIFMLCAMYYTYNKGVRNLKNIDISSEINSIKKPIMPTEPRKDIIKPLTQILFPTNEVRDSEIMGDGDFSFLKLALPDPPVQHRDKIISVLHLHQRMPEKAKLCTVADPKALKIELIRTLHISKPVPVSVPAFDADPGIVIEYGHFAVIMPETFYNITNLESKFLDEAIRVAEKWDIRKYLLN